MLRAARGLRARIALGALIVVAIWEIATLEASRRREPARADWQAASRFVTARHEPGDLVVFAPDWVDPVGRRWFGHLMTIADAGRMDAARYGRIWEVSIAGAVSPEIRDLVADEVSSFGRIRVRRFDRVPASVTWDTRDMSQLCEIAFEPRFGVPVTLVSPGHRGGMSLDGVTLDDELQVYAGSADHRRRSSKRSSALIRVTIDGREVAATMLEDDDGWEALPRVETTPGVHSVEIVVELHDAGEESGMRVCFAAEARSTP